MHNVTNNYFSADENFTKEPFFDDIDYERIAFLKNHLESPPENWFRCAFFPTS